MGELVPVERHLAVNQVQRSGSGVVTWWWSGSGQGIRSTPGPRSRGCPPPGRDPRTCRNQDHRAMGPCRGTVADLRRQRNRVASRSALRNSGQPGPRTGILLPSAG